MNRMMRVMATRPLRYGGRRYEVGDAFEARAGDAHTLIAIRKAKAVQRELGGLGAGPAAAEPPAQGELANVAGAAVDTSSAAGPSAEAPAGAASEAKPRRRYARRDMQAEK